MSDQQTAPATRSADIGELAKALAKAQGQFASVSKDCVNPLFGSKYASLGAIVEAIKKPLSDNGLALAFLPIVNGKESAGVEGLLMHAESGQCLRASCVLPLMERIRKDGRPLPIDAQSVGGAMTYARRYCVSSLLNIVVDDDLDGNEISAANSPQAAYSQARQQAAERKPAPPADVPDDNVKVPPAMSEFRTGTIWQFGRLKGKDLAEFTSKELSSSFDYLLAQSADPAKAKFKEKNDELAAKVMDEIERREEKK